jgi:hypothetical protein
MHRQFVELDSDGNVKATLESERCPGPDPDVVPEGILEVTGQESRDWHRYKWDGDNFVERADLTPAEPVDTLEDRMTRIEALLTQLTNG